MCCKHIRHIAGATCFAVVAAAIVLLLVFRSRDAVARLEDAGVTIIYSYGVHGHKLSEDDVPSDSRFRGVTSFPERLSYNNDRLCTVSLDDVLDAARDLRHVKTVLIAGAAIDVSTMERLCHFRKVNVFIFRQCRITEPALRHLASHASLTQIEFVSCSGFSAKAFSAFSRSKNLCRVSLDHTLSVTPAIILDAINNKRGLVVSVDGYGARSP
jgi:hypothetical protein